MKDELNELEKDFKELLSCIDFNKYDPYSKLYMRALFVGQMYMCMKSLGCEDDVEEELEGAKKYYEMYEETSDSSFKDMASDEARHAGILIKKHLAKTDDEKLREHLNHQEKRRQEILKHIQGV